MVAISRAIHNAPAATRAFIDTHTLATVEKRNYLVETFLDAPDEKWLLTIDSDMTPPQDIAVRLLEAAGVPGRDIVAALYYSRHGFPFHPAAGYWAGDDLAPSCMSTDEIDGSVRRVDWAGTGCMLIRRRVLERLAATRGRSIFRSIEIGGRPTGRGEDLEFCRAAGAEGFGIYCATHIVAGHLGLVEINADFISHLKTSGTETPPPDLRGRIR